MLRLNHLGVNDHRYPQERKLMRIEPRFILPHLDEHASGTERLLAGLHVAPSYSSDVSVVHEWPDREGEAKAMEEGQPLHAEGADGDERSDVWSEVHQGLRAGPSRRPVFEPLRSWDRPWSSPAKDPAQPAFLSEASPFIFETITISNEPLLDIPELKQTSVPVSQDSKELLDVLIRASLGTTTTEALHWDRKTNRFRWDQCGGRPFGIGRVTVQSSMESFLDIGTCFRRLEIIVDTQSSIPLTPTHHALLHTISAYLDYMKQRLTLAVDECATEGTARWNKWIASLKEIRELAQTLCEIMYWPIAEGNAQGLPSRASTLLTSLHGHLLSRLSTGSPGQQHDQTVLALAYIVSHASRPFMTLLHQWIGLADSSTLDEDTDIDLQPWADLGISRSRLSATDDGIELRWQYDFSAKRMPGFIPKDARRILFEAGRSLRLLRDASGGQHPLCETSWGMEASWVWGEERSSTPHAVNAHSRRVGREIEHWRRSVHERARPASSSSSISRLRDPPKRLRKQLPPDFVQTTTPVPRDGLSPETPSKQSDIEALWALLEQSPGSHLRTTAQPGLWAPTPLAELQEFVSYHSERSHSLLPLDTPTLPLFVSTHLLAPILGHANLVSVSLVSLYLDDLRFLDHLDVLRAFWLGGDIGFAERVGAALFGKDEAGAGEALGLGRRARTRVRLGLGGEEGGSGNQGEWGIGLGFGLSDRQRWPPGGAELAYALRTTLLDDGAKVDHEKGSAWEGIGDRVSFAVRSLPENEPDEKRARWMDPQAIEYVTSETLLSRELTPSRALDFLDLAYSPPAAIATLLPAPLMEKYQTVHNFLLRLSRVDTVVRSLYWDIVHQSDLAPNSVKIGADSGLNRLPKGYRQETRPPMAILMSGSKVESQLHHLRFRMSHFVSALSLYVLDTAIRANWDTMRRRLERLKRRVPGRGDSSPLSPPEPEDEAFSFDPVVDDDDEEEAGPSGVGQLHSIHSLVLYHHVTLARILRACLLGSHAGHQLTSKVLMALFGLILDLGKLVKEVDRGVVPWEDGELRVKEIAAEWEKREAVFLHAIERLSQRTAKSESRAADSRGNETDQDLKLLVETEGEVGEDGEAASQRQGGGGGGLQELLLRLRLGSTSATARSGRWKVNDAIV